MPGDHTYVFRVGGYAHHGIDCRDGTVIHFSGEPGRSKGAARVVRTPMEDLVRGGRIRKQCYRQGYDRGQACSRALNQLGSSGYNLLINNCEHFATWCCTGDMKSSQVELVRTLTLQRLVTKAAATSLIALMERKASAS